MRKILLLGAAGLASVLLASAPVRAADPAGNVVGGGTATIVGGGDNLALVYSGGGAGGGGGARTQPPRMARLENGTTGTGVAYLEPMPPGPGVQAWLTGGGDNAEVVYTNPWR